MNPGPRSLALVALLALVLVAAAACGGAPQAMPVAQVVEAPAPTAAPVAASGAPAAAPTMAPLPEQPPAPAEEPRGAGPIEDQPTALPVADGTAQPGGSPGIRKIIKDGELNMVVDELVRAIDRSTTIALDAGGYVLSTETSTDGPVKAATMKLGVPSEAFEDAMRQLRGLALQLRWERSSGKDVTDEYVDLQSQLTNLQATQARLRDFLKQATTVEEALKVNAELTRIEGDIETIQGRMNYLSDRAAYSTITLYLEQVSPTPTVTPTPSITPTPSVTPTMTPIVWRPTETFDSARVTLQYVLRGLGDFAIWAAVICVPLALVALVLLIPLMLIRRSLRRRNTRSAVPPPPPPPGNGAPRP
jgi:hypothetical protein